MADDCAIVRAEAASKCYGADAGATWALRGVSLAVAAGEFVAVVGRSGCGKTTLLNLLGGMDLPTSGRVILRGNDTARLDDDRLTALRRASVGFVFQSFHLLPTLSVRENIAMPLALAGEPADGRLTAVAARLELAARLDAFPHQLSGGEMQRVALARALIHEPVLLIADEPTGNLDNQTAAVVIELLARLSRENGAAVVMATHSAEAARRADRVVALRDGALVAA